MVETSESLLFLHLQHCVSGWSALLARSDSALQNAEAEKENSGKSFGVLSLIWRKRCLHAPVELQKLLILIQKSGSKPCHVKSDYL